MSSELVQLYSKEAEQSVLGSCLLSGEVLGAITEMLKPEDFYDYSHVKLYRILSDMYRDGKPADFVTIQEELKARDEFNSLGGQSFLVQLVDGVTTTSLAKYHAEIIQDYALKRRMMEAGRMISDFAQKFGVTSADIVSEAERLILKASQGKDTSSPVPMSKLSETVLHGIEDLRKSGGRKASGYSSGFADLDRIITGFQPGSLNIIAARPSMGKTALALNISQFGGKDNPCVLIFSLEMSEQQLAQRMFSAQSGVSLTKIITGNMPVDDFYKVADASEILGQRKIFISDNSELSAADFRTKCRRFKVHHPDLALIVVDYLQLMHADRKRGENRQQETADISRMLKAVAVELECPVIALSQLSRDVERRNEKKPVLSDLRDSGAIEQDADTVILLYRDDYYDIDSESKLYPKLDSKAELRVAKNRNGMTGMCNLTFQRGCTRFVGYVQETE